MPNFLDSIMGGIGAMMPGLGQAGQFLSGVSGLGQLLGASSNRVSNRDYQFAQDLADSGNPREAQRQNEFQNLTTPTNISNQSAFLEGVAPSQAKSYNTIQDATWGEDTRRQTDRIQSMSSSLGMSPWEITGSGGATPLPSPTGPAPQQQQSRSSAEQFLGPMTQMSIAAMNNKTALAQTSMQNQTSKEIAGLQTAGGNLPRQQQLQSAAQTILTTAQTANTQQQTQTGKAQESLTWTQGAVAENSIVLNAISTLLQTLPTTEINLGAYKTTERHGYEQLLDLAKTLGDASKTPEAVGAAIANMPAKQWSQMEKEVIQMATLITKGAKGGMDLVSQGSRFLKGLFK